MARSASAAGVRSSGLITQRSPRKVSEPCKPASPLSALNLTDDLLEHDLGTSEAGRRFESRHTGGDLAT